MMERNKYLATLKLIAEQSPKQHDAGLLQLSSLEKGYNLDNQAIDTIRGPTELPGSKP